MDMQVKQIGQNIKPWLLYGFLAYFSYLMILISIQYIPVDFDVAFLRIKQDEIKLGHYQLAFFVHVYTCIFILLAGFIQFSKNIRNKFPKVHKNTGRFYVLGILLLAGPSGLVMGYYANGGPVAQTAFCLLAALWMYFTAMAFNRIKNRDITGHRKFMYRSYALTLSAISLRLFKWIIVTLFHPAPMDTYVLVAWLGWVVNLVICELIIYRQFGQPFTMSKSKSINAYPIK
jgi:uncharacterized membrane protein